MDNLECFSTCTPDNIMNFTEEEVLDLADKLSEYRSVPVKVKMRVLKYMYLYYGFQLTNDLILALLTDVRQQLILAPAGGCKTTSSQIKLILMKIFWSRVYKCHLTSTECLCLVYNAENRPQMDQKHIEMLTPLIMNHFITYNTQSSSYVNAGITSHTLHSFCNYWIKTYNVELGLSGYNIIKDEHVNTFFISAIKKVLKENVSVKTDIKVDKIQTLYDLVHGLNLTYEQITLENELLFDAINSCGLETREVCKVFEIYDSTKKFFKKYDFTDMLLFMDKLLEQESVRERMYSLYTCIVVDEIQDFTPLMMKILMKMVGPKTRLLAIGDEDQCIYSFRGANVDNAVKFQQIFKDSKTFQLVVNRRCGNSILNAASRVINLNKERYAKRLVAERTGGGVKAIPYQSQQQQFKNIINWITSSSLEDKKSTVICAREKIYGQPITFSLFQANIPFYTLNARRFDFHEAFRGFIEVMNLLWNPVRDNWRNLYKIVNIKKDDWFAYIDYDVQKHKVKGFSDCRSLWELKFEPFVHYMGLYESLQHLHHISKSINTNSCSEFINYIIDLFKKNFWEIRSNMEVIPFSEDVFEWVRSIFSKELSYPALYNDYSLRMSIVNSNQSSKVGVAVATMHALKGLEFKNVHMTYLDESIFPAFESIDNKGYSKETTIALKEAENRLAYVAMTRAKDNLILHYNQNDPSFYISVVSDIKTHPDKGSERYIFSNRKVW